MLTCLVFSESIVLFPSAEAYLYLGITGAACAVPVGMGPAVHRTLLPGQRGGGSPHTSCRLGFGYFVFCDFCFVGSLIL